MRWARKTGIAGGETISFAQCWELARRWYAGRDALEWRPKSHAEMARVFADVGLTSPFWSLDVKEGGASG